MTFAVWSDWENVGIGEALLISLIAIIIVFLVLTFIISITHLFQKGLEVVDRHTTISPKEENKILNEDEDAVVAVSTATIDFYKETGKEASVKSITRIED